MKGSVLFCFGACIACASLISCGSAVWGAEIDLRVTVAHYRDRPVKSLPPEVMTPNQFVAAWRAKGKHVPASVRAAPWREAHNRFVGALTGTILTYWCERLNLVVEPAQIDREQRRILESRHGKSKLTPQDIWPLLRRDTELLFVAPPQVGLVSLYHADPEAGERAYEDHFADVLPQEAWRQVKQMAKSGEAFREFAAPLMAADLTRSAREAAKQDLQKKALAKELKARGAIRTPDDLRQWLQGELAHVTAARLDVVALFVSRPDGQFIPGVPTPATGPGVRLELPVPPPAPARPDGREKGSRVPRWSEEGAHDIPLDEVPPYEEVRPQEFEEPERKQDPRSPAEPGKREHKEKPRRDESKAPPREPGNDVPPGVIENLPFESEKPEDFEKPEEEQ